jgi:hypothetical protein
MPLGHSDWTATEEISKKKKKNKETAQADNKPARGAR